MIMHKETEIIARNWPRRDTTTATTINPPAYRGSTVLFDCYADMLKSRRNQYHGISYGTDRLPTQRQFEEAMRQLEGGAVTRVFPSGIAAIQTALMAFVGSGQHLLLVDNAYGPGRRFIHKVLQQRYQVQCTVVPANVGAEIENFVQPNTTLIFLESPGSNTFELQDLPAITAVARKRGIVTLLDATWATPLYLKPFALGIDATIHSVTKYISGYSDVLAGTVTVGETHAERFADFYKLLEIYTPAEECYLALRGLHSLGVRLRQHQQSALMIATWLSSHPLIDQVLHPALPSHPEHHLWKRDFQGASGLFAFTLKEEYGDARLASFIDTLQLFRLGFSWGGYQSLLTAAKPQRTLPCRYRDKTVFRLNVGLEDPEDLRHDLEKGLAMLM
jgi:cysteine-S-conjugate beta-lyase